MGTSKTPTVTITELLKALKSPHPEDLFGVTATKDSVNRGFKSFALLVHPDKAKDLDPKIAAEAFSSLDKLKDLALKKIEDKTFGDKTVLPKPITVGTKKNSYTLKRRLPATDTSNLYLGSSATQDILLKVVKSPADNDLLKREVHCLKTLRSDPKTKDLNTTLQLLPEVIDTFTYVESGKHRETVVFKAIGETHHTLEEVHAAFPKGVPLKHLAWMFNRLLSSLEGAHLLGMVHGAIIPSNFTIIPRTHFGILNNWEYSVDNGQRLKLVAGGLKYRQFYPAMVFNKQEITADLDLYMASKLFIYMSGGSIHRNIFPDDWIPKDITSTQLKGYKNIQGLMRSYTLTSSTQSHDVGVFYNEFREALQLIFGPPKFHEFVLP